MSTMKFETIKMDGFTLVRIGEMDGIEAFIKVPAGTNRPVRIEEEVSDAVAAAGVDAMGSDAYLNATWSEKVRMVWRAMVREKAKERQA